MASHSDFELDADAIVTAAVEIFVEGGLDAVSMRSVSTRLGVSPIPLYSRVGNKEALVDAVAHRLLTDVAPAAANDEPWDDYAIRWAGALRARLQLARDSRLILSPGRAAYVEASRPLVAAMRRAGFARDAAVRACRLVMWATVGFGAVAAGAEPPARRRRRAIPAGDPDGLDAAEIDALFELHVRYLIDGIRRDAATEGGAPERPTPPTRPATASHERTTARRTAAAAAAAAAAVAAGRSPATRPERRR